MKTCTKCKKEQPLSEYHKDNYRKSCLCNKCKTCTAKYDVWKDMVKRCTNPNHKSYKNYGGRGINVCKEWLTLKGMEPFIEKYWKKGLQLDRIDNNKGYSPDNCRFVTPSENTNNRNISKTSIFIGVCFRRDKNKYHTDIKVNGSKKFLGYFDNEIDAAKARDKYVIENNINRQLNFQ